MEPGAAVTEAAAAGAAIATLTTGTVHADALSTPRLAMSDGAQFS